MRWPAEQVAVNEPQAGGRSGRGRRAEGPSVMVAEGGGREEVREIHTRTHSVSVRTRDCDFSLLHAKLCAERFQRYQNKGHF